MTQQDAKVLATESKSINLIGLLISIIASFMIFSNVMGAISWSIFGMFDETIGPSVNEPFSFIIDYFIEGSFMMLALAIIYLIGGIHLRKYKMWANRLLTILSTIIFILTWFTTSILVKMFSEVDGMGMFAFAAFVVAIVWTSPIALLIWYLNRNKIKSLFS